MTVRELVEKLQAMQDQDAEVLAYNGDAEDMVPVTGMVYGGDDKVVLLETDDIS